MEDQGNKPHRKRHSGPSAVKKKLKTDKEKPKNKPQNKKAFAFKSSTRAARSIRHSLDKDTKRHHVPQSEPTVSSFNTPPYIVAVIGPPKVGKSTLIRSLVKNYTRQNLKSVFGPITVVSGRNRRITFIEVENDMCSMIDVAKIADLCLLLIDASFGFEIETFEFINILQVHGFPQVMGVLTHLDLIPRQKTLRRAKKDLRHRFWTEIYQGAKVFYLSGILNGDMYPSMEIHNLSRFISVMRFHPIQWRLSHAFFLADRMEDLTPHEDLRLQPLNSRNIALYGYVRGTNLPENSWVHIPGCGDYSISEVKMLEDPCPLPDAVKKRRNLNEKQRLIYAPNCGLGQLSLDKDAIYVDLPAKNVRSEPSNDLISAILHTSTTVDDKMADSSGFALFGNSNQMCEIDSDSVGEGEKNRADSDDNDSVKSRENDLSDGESSSESDVSTDTEIEDSVSDSDSDQLNDFSTDTMNESTKVIEKGYKKLITGESWSKMYKEYLQRRLGSHANLQDHIYKKKEHNFLQREYEKENSSLLADLFIVRNEKNHENDDSFSAGVFKLNFDEEQVCQEIKNLFVSPRKSVKFQEDFATNDGDYTKSFTELDGEGNEIEPMNPDQNSDSESDHLNEEIEVEEKTTKASSKEKSDFFTEMKQQSAQQELINKEEFTMEESAPFIGYQTGSYVRVTIESVPCEFVQNIQPNTPLIMGTLSPQELNTNCFIHARIKQHRWHKKVLKTRDPIIVSLGWRRFQTLPIYYIEEHNMRRRMLKYTPEHSHCCAVFNGPVTSPGTGVLAVQKLTANSQTAFRVSLTGIALENSQSINVVKKLKLTGTPFKIYKNTAFIKDMFNSALEVAKFERSNLQTVSGIRGQIKRSISKPPGCFRATFEDKILMSDIVFLRAWYQVDLPRYYNPVCNLLDHEWSGMKTVAEIRREKNLSIPYNKDSIYKKVERITPKFPPLKIPRKLEKDLPFKSKPKYSIRSKGLMNTKAKAVILEPSEQKVFKMFQQLRAGHNEHLRKRKVESKQRRDGAMKAQKKVQLKRLQNTKQRKKAFYRKVGKQERKGRK